MHKMKGFLHRNHWVGQDFMLSVGKKRTKRRVCYLTKLIFLFLSQRPSSYIPFFPFTLFSYLCASFSFRPIPALLLLFTFSPHAIPAQYFLFILFHSHSIPSRLLRFPFPNFPSQPASYSSSFPPIPSHLSLPFLFPPKGLLLGSGPKGDDVL